MAVGVAVGAESQSKHSGPQTQRCLSSSQPGPLLCGNGTDLFLSIRLVGVSRRG